MDHNTWLAILTGALVLVTAYYAWMTRKQVAASREMVAATRDMVEAVRRAYALSVVPKFECRSLTREMPVQPPDTVKRQYISETTIKNLGPYRARLLRVRLETDSDGEHVRRFVDRWLAPHDVERVQIQFGQSAHTKVLVYLEDVAGEGHVVIPESA